MRVVVVPVLSDNYSLCSQGIIHKKLPELADDLCELSNLMCVVPVFMEIQKSRRSCVFFCDACYAKKRCWDTCWSMMRKRSQHVLTQRRSGESVSEWSFRHRMLCSQLPHEGAHCFSESQGGKGRNCGSHFLRCHFLQFDKLFSQQILQWGSHNSPSYGSCWRQCRDGEAGGGPTNESSNQRPQHAPQTLQVPSVKVYGGRIDKVAACTNPLERGGVFRSKLAGWQVADSLPQLPVKKTNGLLFIKKNAKLESYTSLRFFFGIFLEAIFFWILTIKMQFHTTFSLLNLPPAGTWRQVQHWFDWGEAGRLIDQCCKPPEREKTLGIQS